MSSLNSWVGVGNLTRDPEVKYLADGKAVTNVSMALNRSWGENEEVTFVDLVFFSKLAEIVGEYGKKGAQMGVRGRLKLDQWEKDGNKFSKLVIVGEDVQLMGRKSDSASESKPTPKAKTTSRASAPATQAEEIPF